MEKLIDDGHEMGSAEVSESLTHLAIKRELRLFGAIAIMACGRGFGRLRAALIEALQLKSESLEVGKGGLPPLTSAKFNSQIVAQAYFSGSEVRERLIISGR